jgi:RimJ/RimL family protein N-acetyltransferase
MHQTERMALTRTNWPDIDDLIALSADSENGDRGHARSMTVAQVLAEEMPRLMAHNRGDDRLGSWVARDRVTGRFLGWFTMTAVEEPPRAAELTYRLRRQVRGLGYDLEGTRRMLEIAQAAELSTVIVRHRPS